MCMKEDHRNYREKEQDYRAQARKLIAQMTLEEKVTQTLHQSVEIELSSTVYSNRGGGMMGGSREPREEADTQG